MWQAIKNVILWNYKRTSWQYEIIVGLALAFIFLTPPAWFQGRERSLLTNESRKVVRLIVGSSDFSPAASTDEQLNLVRALAGNNDVQRFEVRERKSENGAPIGFEIDVY